MDPGDLVEFKPGLHGLDEPENLGIYLDRIKKSKSYFLVLHTLQGRKEIKQDHATDRRFQAHVDPDQPASGLTHALKGHVKRARRGDLEEVQEVGDVDLSDRDLWQDVKGLGEASLEEIASAYFGETEPSGHQVNIVRDVLESCQDPGVGYFERAEGRGERWHVLSQEDYRAAKEEAEAVAAVKNKLLTTREIEPDDEDDEVRIVTEGLPLDEAGLTDDDWERLELLGDVMEEFLRYDEHRGGVTLAGTFVHTIDGFRLFTVARDLAEDWTGLRGTISARFAAFLHETGLRDVDELVDIVAQRKVLEHDHFTWEVPDEARRGARRIPDEPPAEEVERRRDLRDLTAWTIDPPDAEDFDDAVTVDVDGDGSATLWVHIADVAHHVEPDGFVDHHARKRATSVYLPVRVLPMLPHRLADDLCSLRAREDRLAVSVRLDVDPGGDVVDHDVVESVVHVDENLAYGTVDEAVEEGEDPFAAMEALARRMESQRIGLDLETDERQIRLADDGVDLELKSSSPSTRMIEQFMVAANEAVARTLRGADLPFPYRCHPLPDAEDVGDFNAQMAALGVEHRIDLPNERPAAGVDDEPEADEDDGEDILDQLEEGGKMELTQGGGVITGVDEEDEAGGADPLPAGGGEDVPFTPGLAQVDPEDRPDWLDPFNEVLAAVDAMEDDRLRDLVGVKTLATLGRALYTGRNMGHFGLGSACYAHFTSPIRRYPDLVVHRQLKWWLQGGDPDEEDPPHDPNDVEELAGHATEMGHDAEKLEWTVIDVALAFLAKGGEWDGAQPGLVQGFSPGAVFASLPGHLEARLPLSNVPGGPWSVDDHETTLFRGEMETQDLAAEVTADNWEEMVDEATGEATEVKYRLGETVQVEVTDVDLVDGEVRVRPASDDADDGSEDTPGPA
jgi:exoribonuclease R